MEDKNYKNLELDKILSEVSDYTTTDGGKVAVKYLTPSPDLTETKRRLSFTRECDKLLYKYGISKIAYFPDVSDILSRAEKGSTLSCGELLDGKMLLTAARSAFEEIDKISDGEIALMRELSEKLYFDENLERDIEEQILSPEAVADTASDKLYSIRSKMRSLNERIRSKLSEYLSKDVKYLQDGIVTMRNDRYVIPVKAEYKSHVRGFVHDRSKTGATYFIEPEYVLELNNELTALSVDEREEVEAILRRLSARLGNMRARLEADIEYLTEMDLCLARAEYSYIKKCAEPKVNSRGFIEIIKGRHPLIDRDKSVPVSLTLGRDYDFLLLSGANTGGKTVTLKMCGLFCLMAECGLFIPAAEGSSVSVFDCVYSDIGDSQSIEESLSTFSSHIINVIEICNRAGDKSLVLCDELGGGTNPDEGQALAKAVIKHLIAAGCKGIVTTHFTPLKEFAHEYDRIENASMEFDSDTLKPLYSIKIGLAGASNALAITKKLGMREDILNDAYGFLSDDMRTLENILKSAEDSRVQAEADLEKARALEREYREKLDGLNRQIEEVNLEREKNLRFAKQESRRIIAERTERAEEILKEIEDIFKSEEISESDLIRARTLKNQIGKSLPDEERKKAVREFEPVTRENMKKGVRVFVKAMDCEGEVLGFSFEKGEAEVQCNNVKLRCKLKDLSVIGFEDKEKNTVKVFKSIPVSAPVLEINVMGMTVEEALYDISNFIDKAVTDNLEEVKIIHGLGTGKLKRAVGEYLARHKHVKSFRLGKYGEGESGVTIATLK